MYKEYERHTTETSIDCVLDVLVNYDAGDFLAGRALWYIDYRVVKHDRHLELLLGLHNIMDPTWRPSTHDLFADDWVIYRKKREVNELQAVK